ncbi:MAG: hypothetical protein IJ025_01070 [Clostridia bacterium]|nr:hypothetical protein [Clostridia bacterium]
MIIENTNIEYVEHIKNSVFDIPKSGNYIVRSNNQLVWIEDFKTREILIHKKYRSHIINSITPDEKYGLFTAEGETELVVLSLPDLVKVNSISVDYCPELTFISNNEVMYYQFTKPHPNRDLKIWNFKTNKIETIYSSVSGGGFFEMDKFIRLEDDENAKKHKLIVFNGRESNSFDINKWWCSYDDFSQLNGTKLLCTPRKNGGKTAYLCDVEKQTYEIISEKNLSGLRWITKDFFWFEEHCYKFQFYSGIMDLSGNVLWITKGGYHLRKLTNDNYFYVNYCGDSFLFKILDE